MDYSEMQCANVLMYFYRAVEYQVSFGFSLGSV